MSVLATYLILLSGCDRNDLCYCLLYTSDAADE